MRQADGDIEREKHDVKTTSVNSNIVSACHIQRLGFHRDLFLMSSMMVLMMVSKLSTTSLSLLSSSILTLILVVMVVIIDPLSSSRRLPPISPSGETGYVRFFSISHETRSQPPKKPNTISKLISLLILSSLLSLFQNIHHLFYYLYSLFTNQDLISCLHLLVNDTLSDKEFFTQLVNKS